VEDKLFATLDSTSRRLELSGGLAVLMVDTVGFIRRLPHTLIKAFHSTLEELSLSDILIHVIDASDPEESAHWQTAQALFRELNADYIPRITVLNKADKVEAQENLEQLMERYQGAIPVSALSGEGLPELSARIESILSGNIHRYSFPANRTDLAALLHRNGTVLSEVYQEDQIEMEARVDDATAGKLREFESAGRLE
jgi:GTP-binding protein HflX